MLLNLSQLHYLYQKELSIQLLATFGTSPVVMAPLFNILCLALAVLALIYLLYLITSDTHIHGHHIHLRPTTPVVLNPCFYPNYRYFPRPPVLHGHMHGHGYGNTHIHRHASSSTHHEIHTHQSASSPRISSSGRTHGHS